MPKKKTTKNPFDLSDEDIKWLEGLGIEPTENLFDLCEQLSSEVLGYCARGDMNAAELGGDLKIKILNLFHHPEIGIGSVCSNCAYYHEYEERELDKEDPRHGHGAECRGIPQHGTPTKGSTVHPDYLGPACANFKLNLDLLKEAKTYCTKVAALVCLIDYARWHWGNDGEKDPKTRDEIVYETEGVLEE